MDPVTATIAINLLKTAVETGMSFYTKWEEGKAALSATELEEIDALLLKAQQITALLEPRIRASLQRAIARGD